MCFGGNPSPPPPPAPDPHLEALAANAAAEERRAEEERHAAEERRAAEAQRAAEEAAARRQAFDTNLANAITGFRDAAQRDVTQRGLDWNEFSTPFEHAITSTRGRVADLDPNPGQFFTNDLIDSVLNREQTLRREAHTRAARAAFPPGAEHVLFTDTMDDPFIESILGRQRGEAVSALDVAERRGNLDQRGREGAMARLGEQETAGRGAANTIGSNVLAEYRARMRDIADEAQDTAGRYVLGDRFNLGNFQQRWDTQAGNLRSRLEGEVVSRISAEPFFDIGDILTRGGIAQGAVNPRVAPAVLAEQERLRNTNRGIGGTGVF